MRDIQCPHCESYINAREIVTRCPECKELINNPKTKEMKPTLENFLVKWDGNNPLWKEFIEWLNKSQKDEVDIEANGRKLHYGKYKSKNVALYEYECGFDKSIVITLEQWQQLLNPKTKEMKNPFKEKDTVHHIKYGKGLVIDVQTDTILVKYENESHWHNDLRLLSFTPYTLDGFTQERPFEPVVGQMYYFWDKPMVGCKTVLLGEYVGFGHKEYPYRCSNFINYEHCSQTNPLL
jgi:phage FluMu protein Com